MMPSYLLKPDRDTDLYVMWSTVVDNWTRAGARAEWVKYGEDPVRLARADERGTSCLGFEREGDGYNFGGWDDDGFVLANLQTRPGFRWLPRENLLAYLRAVIAEDYTTAEGPPITRPCDDDPPDPPEGEKDDER